MANSNKDLSLDDRDSVRRTNNDNTIVTRMTPKLGREETEVSQKVSAKISRMHQKNLIVKVVEMKD
jgi:hypothetical protein